MAKDATGQGRYRSRTLQVKDVTGQGRYRSRLLQVKDVTGQYKLIKIEVMRAELSRSFIWTSAGVQNLTLSTSSAFWSFSLTKVQFWYQNLIFSNYRGQFDWQSAPDHICADQPPQAGNFEQSSENLPAHQNPQRQKEFIFDFESSSSSSPSSIHAHHLHTHI